MPLNGITNDNVKRIFTIFNKNELLNEDIAFNMLLLYFSVYISIFIYIIKMYYLAKLGDLENYHYFIIDLFEYFCLILVLPNSENRM